MALEQDITEIKTGIAKLKNRPLSKSRPYLYFMGVCTIIGLIGVDDKIKDLSNKIDSIPKAQQTLQLQTRNVIGQPEPEEFYDINGQRVYLKIDGKPIVEYFNQR